MNLTLNDFSDLCPDIKKNFIDTFLSQCKPNDLHYLESRLNEYKRDFLSYLPCEITHVILDFLDWKDLLNCCQVCSNWNKIISNDINKTWKTWCIRDRLIQQVNGQKDQDINYKNVYLQLKRKEFSLDSGKEFQEWNINMAPAEMNAISCYNNIIASNVNHIVYFWKLNDQLNEWILDNQLSLETSAVDFKFNTDFLIYVSYDYIIHLYSLNTNELICTFIGHTAKITSFDFNSNILVSCSADRTLRVWSLQNDKNLIQTSQIEEYPIKISILESISLNLILTVTSQSVIYVQHFSNSDLTIDKIYSLNETNLDYFDYNDLSDKTYFKFNNTQLIGYFILNNNSKKENKLFIEIFNWNHSMNKFEYESFENNSYFDYLNQFKLDYNDTKFEIITFGLKYCLFVDQFDDIYLTNLKTKLISLVFSSKDNLNLNKKGIFEFGNSQVGRKNNFKFNNATNWLNSLDDFVCDNKKYLKNNEPVFIFHGGNLRELFIIGWKS